MAVEISIRLLGETTWIPLPDMTREEADGLRGDSDPGWLKVGDDQWCRTSAIAELRIKTTQDDPEPEPSDNTYAEVLRKSDERTPKRGRLA